MDERWTEEEIKLVEQWAITMPQLQSVFMTYGYTNSEGINISRFDNIADMEGRRALIERSRRGNWKRKWYDDSRVVLQSYPYGLS